MAGTKASQVPAMVASHQDYLRTHLYQQYVGGLIESAWRASGQEDFIASMTEIDGSLEHAARMQGIQVATEEASMLNISALFHVTESMLEVAKHAAIKLDDYDRWSAEVLPAPVGFMVFERPLLVEDVWGHMVAYHAFSWKRVSIPDVKNPAPDHKHTDMPSGGEIAFLNQDHHLRPSRGLDPKRLDGLEIGDTITTFHLYTDVTDMSDAYTRSMRDRGSLNLELGRWQMSHMGGQADGAVVGPMTFSDNDEIATTYRAHVAAPDDINSDEDRSTIGQYIPSSGNMFRIFYSIFELMNQTVAVLSEETDKRLARRIKGKHRPPPMVTVIRLRRPEIFGEREEGTGQWLMYRSITRSHYRRQHYKDGTTKKIFIHAYWRGPEDGPVWQPQRVTTLER